MSETDEPIKNLSIYLRSDEPLGIRSKEPPFLAVGFNLSFILKRDPTLALAIMELSDRADNLQHEDPVAPDEDMALALEQFLERYGSDATTN